MRIHCIGIGGIGVSALAQYYLTRGHQVSGSDLDSSEVTEFLKTKGVTIVIGNKAEHILKDTNLVIYSPAVQASNPEYQRAKELGITLQSYPEALGELTKKYTTIAVSGSHGKSTTTAMVALILTAAGFDPTVIIGTKLKEFALSASSLGGGGATNFRAGKSKYLVIEACEYDGSFLNYQPHITVITNIDKEHMDYFKTMANVKKTFKDFIMRLPANGWLVANKEDKTTSLIRANKRIKEGVQVKEFSLRQPEAKKITLQIPGKHNIANALAALQVAQILGISDTISLASLAQYKGSWRRFEIIKEQPYTVVSDYGHHPNEVAATLKAGREKFARRKIWLIYQPHQYQRTYYLFKDFIKVFQKAPIDHIIITDIYDVAGREEKQISSSVSSESLVKKIAKKHVQYMTIDKAEIFVKQHIKRGDVLIIMGAGNIYKLANKF